MDDVKVIPFAPKDRETGGDIDPKAVLREAPELQTVVIVGWDAEGDFYFASSVGDGGEVLWLLAMAQKKLLEMGEPE